MTIGDISSSGPSRPSVHDVLIQGGTPVLEGGPDDWAAATGRTLATGA
ncbi:hypothetical protein GFS60_06414 (plasmid) [Rhodococcus sp. WAY2]|nr:hypothetical protein GFS60_06414 [Rhodococcus sp. WAY2]